MFKFGIMTAAVAAGTAIVAGAAIVYCFTNKRKFSQLVERYSTIVEIDHRSAFRDIKIRGLGKQSSAHSHATAAAIRTSMNQAIDDYIAATDRQGFSVSMSKADERSGMRGNRYFYTAKDLSYGFKDDHLLSGDVVKMSDCGYYLDLPSYLDGHEVILYEIVPFRAAASVADATYQFDKEGRLVEYVNGEAFYQHHLWDYGSDCILVPKWNGTWEYLVEKISHPEFPEYRIIGLFPRRFVPAPFSWMLSGKQLTRRQHVRGGWVTVHSQHSEGNLAIKYVSAAKLDNTAEFFIPLEVVECVAMRYHRLGKVDMGAVESYLEHEMKRELYSKWNSSAQSYKTMAIQLVEYIADSGLARGSLLSVPTRADAYEPINREYRPLTEVSQSIMRVITPDGRHPIVSGAVAPVKGRAAEFCAVEERITKVRNDVDPPRRYHKYRKEFVKNLVPNRGMGRPYSFEELDNRMPRPTQKAITAYAMNWLDCDKPVNKAFVKSEAYPSANAVRMISTLPPSLKSRYAVYIYALVDDVLKNQPFYAFSKTPQELAERLSHVASDKSTACSTDYTKFDGKISAFMRDFERMVLQAWITPELSKELTDLHAKQMKLRGVTRSGIGYEPGFHRLSGSSETSAFNTIDNAFIEYCAYRESGLDDQEAWNSLGLYGGDDGVSFDLEPAIAMRTARDMGFELKCENIQRGDVIPFLGRLWYYAWVGNAKSTCDWKRQMMKLHLTASRDLCFIDVLRGKALGFWYTDRDTPIIGDWAKRVLEITGTRPVDVDGEEAPLNSASSWQAGMGTFEQPDREIMERTMRTTTGWDDTVCQQLLESILSAKKLEHLFPTNQPIFSFDTPIKVPCVLNGERRQPPVAAGPRVDPAKHVVQKRANAAPVGTAGTRQARVLPTKGPRNEDRVRGG